MLIPAEETSLTALTAHPDVDKIRLGRSLRRASSGFGRFAGMILVWLQMRM